MRTLLFILEKICCRIEKRIYEQSKIESYKECPIVSFEDDEDEIPMIETPFSQRYMY